MEGIDLGTLADIVESERRLRALLGEESYRTAAGLLTALHTLTPDRAAEVLFLLAALRDHCRALRAVRFLPAQ